MTVSKCSASPVACYSCKKILNIFLPSLLQLIRIRLHIHYLLYHVRVNFAFYWHDAAKRQTAGIKFTHRPKIRVGRLVAPIYVKLGRADGQMGPFGCAKFHLNRHSGWECGPPNIKNFHFLVKSRPAGVTSLTDSKICMCFYTTKYPISVFQISCDVHHRLRSYC